MKKDEYLDLRNTVKKVPMPKPPEDLRNKMEQIYPEKRMGL